MFLLLFNKLFLLFQDTKKSNFLNFHRSILFYYYSDLFQKHDKMNTLINIILKEI